jgi:hypothetical protein
LEESSSHASAEHGLRLELIAADSKEVHTSDDQVREDMIAVAYGLVGVPREAVEPWFRLAGIVVEEFDELPWIAHGERMQHQAIRHGEDRGVRADAEGEREYGDRGETRRFAQHAQAEAQVLNQGFKEMRALGFAAFFLELLVAAELEPGASPGLCTRNAGTLEVIGAILDVRAQFLFHLLVNPRPMKERRNH